MVISLEKRSEPKFSSSSIQKERTRDEAAREITHEKRLPEERGRRVGRSGFLS